MVHCRADDDLHYPNLKATGVHLTMQNIVMALTKIASRTFFLISAIFFLFSLKRNDNIRDNVN